MTMQYIQQIQILLNEQIILLQSTFYIVNNSFFLFFILLFCGRLNSCLCYSPLPCLSLFLLFDNFLITTLAIALTKFVQFRFNAIIRINAMIPSLFWFFNTALVSFKFFVLFWLSFWTLVVDYLKSATNFLKFLILFCSIISGFGF